MYKGRESKFVWFAGGRIAGGMRLFGAALAVTAIMSGPAQALTCPASDEQNSLTVRALQSKLMVAALTCSARSDYNDFVRRYTPYLADHAVSLRRWFRKLHGGRSTREIDRFVTSLANNASMKSINDRAAFCAASRSAFAELLGAPGAESRRILHSVALEVSWRQDIPAGCQALSQNVPE
jgi:hypothetical protein